MLDVGEEEVTVARDLRAKERLRIVGGLVDEAIRLRVFSELVKVDLREAWPVRHAHGGRDRGKASVIESVPLRIPRDARVLRSVDDVRRRDLPRRDLEHVEHRLVGVVLALQEREVRTVQRRLRRPERHASVRRPSVGVEEHLRRACLALLPPQDGLLLFGVPMRPEVPPLGFLGRALLVDVEQFGESLPYRVTFGQLRQSRTRESVLRSGPRLDLVVAPILEPTKSIVNGLAAEGLDDVFLGRDRVVEPPRHARERGRRRGGRGVSHGCRRSAAATSAQERAARQKS